MPRFFVKLHGRDFAIPRDDSLIRGFLTVRRVVAASPDLARKKAEDALPSDGAIQEYVRISREKEADCRCIVTAEAVFEAPFWTWFFSRVSKAFVFYK